MKPLRERNQVLIAVVGTLAAAVVVLASMNLDKAPFLHPKHTYRAEFANADGLSGGADVRVAGVSVGTVRSVRVTGDHVTVAFTVRRGVTLGGASRASIEVATVLGELFLQVESAGPGVLHPGDTIPVTRTTVPYTLIGALNQFGTFAGATDVPLLQRSLRTLSATLAGIAPDDAKAALRGLTGVAQAVAARQSEISRILDAVDTVTGTLNDNSAALVQLLTQGDEFLALLRQRHAVISRLLTDTAALGAQLTTLMSRHGAQLSSLTANLASIASVLARDKAKLERAVHVLGQFSVNVANAGGTGPWLDLLVPGAVTPDNVLKACGPHPATKAGPCG